MTISKNINKEVDNPEFFREIIQNQLQSTWNRKLLSTLEHSPMKGLKAVVVIATPTAEYPGW